MLNLPLSTEVNRRIPKQKFYENLGISPALKRVFIDDISAVYWRNKLSPDTMNISPGTLVTEVEIFEIRLNNVPLDEAVLRQMDKEIPYHIVFLLAYGGKYQAWTAYKETAIAGSSAFKVSKYFHTAWIDESELPLHAEGLNIDMIYENLVRQIAGDALQPTDDGSESLKDAIEREEKRRQLQRKIEALQRKIRNEKQFNVQVELNEQLRRLVKEVEMKL